MIKISKGNAFIIGMCCIIGMFAVMVLLHLFKMSADFPIGAFLTAAAGLATTYMGIDVANNAARGKFFNENIAKLDALARGDAGEGENNGNKQKH